MEGFFPYTIELYVNPPAEIQKQIDVLDYKTFGGGAIKSKEKQELHNDQYFDIPRFLYIVALEKDTLIGKAGVTKRIINYHGTKITLGGLSGVVTAVEKRNQGVASELVKYAQVELIKANCDIAYLCSDINDPIKTALYSKIGFVPLKKPHIYKGKSGKVYMEHDGMIAPICSQSIFEKVLSDKEPFDIGRGNW